ncbi:hypothetical protein Vadar_011653 [Vaccinium darrowii]|uniref:Uncharacterized protein n=1 Tax=Vaccinium darrowii TaxID=229202 RepID=A0ACB7Y7L8_9ERIC|nr:hypothetical protein Vadar_011653 [Vaccinium darrowii]
MDVLQFRSICSLWRSSLPSGTWPPPLSLTLPFHIVPHSFPHPRARYTLTEATVYRLHNPSNFPPMTWIIKVSENLPEVVVIHNGDLSGLRHGDERWTPLVEYGGMKGGHQYFSSPLNHFLSGNKKHLVESCGELWLLNRKHNKTCFQVYKLKEVEDEWEEVSDLGDRILFAGRDCCSFSVSAANFKGRNCEGNCIFFLYDTYSPSAALWGPNCEVGLDGKPLIYHVGNCCVDRLAAHPGFAHLFQPLPSLLESGPSSSSQY